MPANATTFMDALAAAALLGVERVKGVPGLAPPGRLAARVVAAPAQHATEAMLDLAAAASPWWRAGRIPALIGTSPAPSPDDPRQPCSPAQTSRLAAFVRGGYADVLPEWLELARKVNLRIPDESLPGLLEIGRQRPALRSEIAASIGPRGRWLAEMNVDWRYALATAPHNHRELWQSGARDERVLLLRDVRQNEPAAALDLLRSTWATDPPEDRERFLGELAAGLSMEDEPFLEGCLDDKRKGVRTAAAGLLARLPQSRFVGRMIERATALLSYAKSTGKRRGGAKINATLPAAYEKAWARDTIEERPPPGMGERAWWLQQLLSLVPPRVWSESWQEEPPTLLAAAEETDWLTMLVTAWGSATSTFRDEDWATALLRWWIGAIRGKAQQFVRPQELLNVLPDARRERLVLDLLSKNEGARVSRIIEMLDHRWSVEFSRAILRHCEKSKPAFDLTGRVNCFHHTTAAEVRALLEKHDLLKPHNHTILQHLAKLEFRAQMHTEFAS